MDATNLRRQRGNTLTGIIIGLIVGLLIAVVVALVITKGATPFTDKSGRTGKGATPAQAADPNRPLYGDRDAAREANRQIQERAAQTGDPLGEAIAAMPDGGAQPGAAPAAPAATAAAPAQPAAGGAVVYYLQAGAFRELADAENTRAKLALLGFEATISQRNADGAVLHRVRLGPFDQEAMTRARAKLLDAGVDVAIVRNQN